MDLEELLPSDSKGDFDSYFVIYPDNGYTLNVETRSFGRIASENVIEDITFIPIDIDWLYQQYQQGGTLQALQNNLKIEGVKKYGTWGYKVRVSGDGLLMLGQGYDKGWLGLVQNSKFKVQSLKHVKVNSWANGWLINDQWPMADDQNLALNHQSSTIYLVFWPQLLQSFGFLLILLLGVVFIYKKSRYHS
jgi:hypothetical protein